MVELATPIRLYWDLAPGQPADAAVERLCDDIAALRFLSVHLHDPGDTLAPATWRALERLAGPGRALLLTASIPAAATLPLSTPLRQLFVPVYDQSGIAAASHLAKQLAPLAVGISLPLPHVQLPAVPGLVQAAAAAGIGAIHFPMQRLTAGATCWVPTQAELATVAFALSLSPLPAEVRLTIHDPFVWRAFHGGQPFPDGGCQAANTMLYLAPDGRVYSCPLLPVDLGRLPYQSLAEIVAGTAKRELRVAIRAIPPACTVCPDLAGCRAGCRGRAFVCQGWGAADPACGQIEPRS